ncbi:MAG: hypothetical protein AAFX56_03690 [Pseudomonadota bacterium]
MSSTGIVFIVLIACITGLAAQWLNDRKERREAASNQDADETIAQLEAIEARVRVLERIVTENKFDLKHEIDRL